MTNKDMTVSQAGKKGGKATFEKYGTEHYKEMGRKGGEAVIRSRGPEFYSEIGRKGGRVLAQRGHDYFAKLGKLGGLATKAKHDPKGTGEYYQGISPNKAKPTDDDMVEIKEEWGSNDQLGKAPYYYNKPEDA